jgi:hypothetical protein
MERRDFIKCFTLFGISITNEININFFTATTDLKNKLSLLKKIDISNESTEGGSILCYYNNDNNLKKFTISQYGESARQIAHVYINNDEICKISETLTKYNRPINYDKELALSLDDNEWHDDKKSKVTIRRLLINDDMIYENKSYNQCNAENIDLYHLKSEYDRRLLDILTHESV